MALTKIQIASFVEQYNQTCDIPNLTPDEVSGINRDKVFFEPSHQVGSDTSKYKIVPPNYFACNLMHVGRDVVLPVALNMTNSNKVVSPAYTIFSITNESLILKEYFYILLNSDEKDRYFWFNTDSSVRDGMSWEDFCNLEIQVPPLPIQQKYVDVYKAMLANQKSYERGLEDLKLTCDAYIENLRREMPCEKIQDVIQLSDKRNNDYKVKDNKAVSIEKIFVDAHADLNGVDIGNYYVVEKGQFAYNTVTTRNGDKISIAYNVGNDCLVSPIYTVFDVKEEKIIPEYLMLWYKRSEFDRYSRFHSWGSAREMFTFEDMKNVEIPIPSISIQTSISNMYTVLMERRNINEKLKSQLKDICPILIKGSLEEARQEEAHG